ncbi:MAG: hypothetical protein ACXAB8_12150 [Promethearchaeota archaeon]|jgi:hypothetical protein
MVNNLFQVDWIFVDTIIIVLLVMLLIGVRIFKSIYRWRFSFSNIDLDHYSFHQTHEQPNSQSLNTKYWELTKNTTLTNAKTSNKVIIIVRTTYKKKLLRVLTEGLCSYGFIIISLKIKKKGSENINDELHTLISSIIEKSEQKNLIKSSYYVLLEYTHSWFPSNVVLSDPNNTGLILLNPKMTKNHLGTLQEIINSQQQHSQLFYIFNKKSFYFLKNKNVKRYKTYFGDKSENKIELITLEKSNSNFKYYETILLGILIDIIENKLVETKVHD